MARILILLAYAAICSVWLTSATAYKILMLPNGNKSHLIEFHGLGSELLRRGHEVHIYLSKVDTPLAEVAKAGYKFIYAETDESMMTIIADEEKLIKVMDTNFLEQMIKNREEGKEYQAKVQRVADIMMNDKSNIELMRQEKYDFAVVDNVVFTYYMFLLPHKLGIPYGGLTTWHEPINNRVPFLPSVFSDIVMSMNFGVQHSSLGTSFWARFKNLIGIAMHASFIDGYAMDTFKRENVTLHDILSRIAFHMIDQHNLLSDPTPTMPNIFHVGGLVTRPANPITDKSLLEFIDNSDQPVIVCSFGSMMGSLTPEIMDRLMNSFRQVPQYKVVMRLKGSRPANVPPNVHLMAWLPQNDLLAHNRTALLVTHSGNNGQGEALFHGVPMVAFYIFADQEYNADRVARRGYAKKLNLLKFTEQELVDAINEVMNNATYRERIKKASAISLEVNAAQKAADLVEHVIQFGSDHLRPHEAFELSLVQFWMLDVLFFIYSLVTVLLLVVFAITKRALKRAFACLR